MELLSQFHPVAGELLFRPWFPALLHSAMRHPAQLLNVNHFRQRCMKARTDTPIPPYYSNRLCFIC